MMTRRVMLVAPMLVLPSTLLRAQHVPGVVTPPKGCEEYAADWGRVRGDEGYGHSPLRHMLYTALFEQHCPCHGRECRETIFRPTEFQSETGWDVWINRRWYPLNNDAFQPSKRQVIARLKSVKLDQFAFDQLFVSGTAHVCAYPNQQTYEYCSRMQIRCAIINPTGV